MLIPSDKLDLGDESPLIFSFWVLSIQNFLQRPLLESIMVPLAATRDSSNLLAHEAAFALGQMQEADAVPALISVLNDLALHPIVRHEVSF